MDKMRIFTPLIDGFQQKEGLAREDACANLVYLVNELPCVCHENARHLCLKCLAFQEQTHGIFF